jgi:hypothetical protein
MGEDGSMLEKTSTLLSQVYLSGRAQTSVNWTLLDFIL